MGFTKVSKLTVFIYHFKLTIVIVQFYSNQELILFIGS